MKRVEKSNASAALDLFCMWLVKVGMYKRFDITVKVNRVVEMCGWPEVTKQRNARRGAALPTAPSPG